MKKNMQVSISTGKNRQVAPAVHIILPIFMFIIQLLISVTNVINTFSKPLTAVLNNWNVYVFALNRTEVPQTFLWWANPAVAVNDYYPSVFPTDINAAFDHGKRAVSSFPIATGVYS